MGKLLVSRSFVAGVVLTAAGAPCLAQCSMCRTAAASQGAGAAGALNAAIVILLVPALALFCGIFLLAVGRQGPEGRGESPRNLEDRPGVEKGCGNS